MTPENMHERRTRGVGRFHTAQKLVPRDPRGIFAEIEEAAAR